LKRVLFILSLSANCVLGMLALHFARPAATAPPAMPRGITAEIPAETNATEPAALVTNLLSTTFTTNRFHWRTIESEDYDQYVANLRGVGCPERTVRDIILADVEDAYTSRQRGLVTNIGFWTSGKRRAAAEHQREKGSRQLEEEKRALLTRLLGPDYDSFPDGKGHQLTEYALLLFVLGPMPEAQSEHVFAVMNQRSRAQEAFDSQFQGFLLPEDEAAQKNLMAQAKSVLESCMTPAQYEEFGARCAAIRTVDTKVGGFRMTPMEARGVAMISSVSLSPVNGSPFPLFDSYTPTDEQQAEYQAQLKTFLGPNRYEDYQRETNPDFQQARDFTEANELPDQTARKLYEIKQLADAELKRARSDSALTERDQEEQMRQTLEVTRAAVHGLLTESAYNTYVAGYGSWMTNVARPR
jgi:hypothetical protein